jgi:DNA excision repair protein ERCC-3
MMATKQHDINTAPAAPLIVQQDGSLILATEARGARSVADGLRCCAELVKCPGAFHHYQLTAPALWQAAATGVTARRVLDFLQRASGAPAPPAVERRIRETIARVGQVRLVCEAGALWLRAADQALLARLAAQLDLAAPGPDGLPVAAVERGVLKARLARLGWPVSDEAGWRPGAALALGWRADMALRPYQRAAIAAFDRSGTRHGGSGLVLLPCGAGKTLVGVGATVALGCRTLVLCPSSSSARQWVDAYQRFTDLPAEAVGEYNARRRHVPLVTVTTYQQLTARRGVGYPHLDLVGAHPWGLIIFDEAHLLPADVFRLTAAVQTRRRLGLTATPVREDGREADLAALIGPVVYAAPWRRLASEGWIAPVSCVEVRVPLAGEVGTLAALPYRAAATAAEKWPVVRALVRRHRSEGVLVIGQYLDQLRDLAARLEAPLIVGTTPRAERERAFDRFRAGAEPVLVLSRVGNAAIDLPNARVGIEVSGNFGSRQEEAQRLGRLLRPKPDGQPAHFYAVIASDTVEGDHAARRQRFLVEQGYEYRIVVSRQTSGSW